MSPGFKNWKTNWPRQKKVDAKPEGYRTTLLDVILSASDQDARRICVNASP
jgi:hypothetical protein